MALGRKENKGYGTIYFLATPDCGYSKSEEMLRHSIHLLPYYQILGCSIIHRYFSST